MSTLVPSELPIIQAPMAGGPSTPALTAAVAEAGGYGFVAGGYLTPDGLLDLISATRSLTGAPFGVNLFCPSAPADPGPIREYARTLGPKQTAWEWPWVSRIGTTTTTSRRWRSSDRPTSTW